MGRKSQSNGNNESDVQSTVTNAFATFSANHVTAEYTKNSISLRPMELGSINSHFFYILHNNFISILWLPCDLTETIKSAQ